MQAKKVLKRLQNDQPIVVKNFTFEPDTMQHAILETGEDIYWFDSEEGRWISIETHSEEILFFEELDEPIEAEDEVVVFQNHDFEFSYEGKGELVDDDGEVLEPLSFKDYEYEGQLLRIIESEVTNDRMVSLGEPVAEMEISEP